MKNLKRFFLLFSILLIVVGSCMYIYDGVVWMREYHKGLIPELVFTLPVEECGTILSGKAKTSRVIGATPELLEICRERGYSSRYMFALKGRKAVRFVPVQFRSVKGKLETEEADPGTVYFYQYNPSYYPIMSGFIVITL